METMNNLSIAWHTFLDHRVTQASLGFRHIDHDDMPAWSYVG